MKPVILPNGHGIWSLNDLETAMLYHEIFEMQSYSKHGIKISDGDCIFDVGANIGLYSLFLVQTCRAGCVFAFEPIPDIFAVLQRNIQAYANIKTLNVGLSDQRGKAQFEFDPASSMTTTMRPKEVEGSIRKRVTIYEWLTAGVTDLHRAGRMSDSMTAFILKALAAPLAKPFAAAVLLIPLIVAGLRKKLSLRRVECVLTTISDVIREQNIGTIHLIKIDVEGSELAVIDGIAADDWPKIRQLVVEVHDIDSRVEAMRGLFERNGYRTIVDQEDWALHKLLGIFTLYAIRD